MPVISSSNLLQDSFSLIPPKKKRRLSDGNGKIIDLINDRDPERAWPIIQIAVKLYKKYPDSLQFDEYLEFFDVIVKLMSQACKKFTIMEDICELTTVFIQNENMYEKYDVKVHWDKIWDLSLRYLLLFFCFIVM